MDAAQFRLPVRLHTPERECINEIYSAEEALDFLLAWPGRHGPVYEKAVKACFAATVEVDSADTAQRAFASFARLSHILAKDMWPAKAKKRPAPSRLKHGAA